MPVRIQHTKRDFCVVAIWTFLFGIAGLPGFAQDKGGTTDSAVAVSDTTQTIATDTTAAEEHIAEPVTMRAIPDSVINRYKKDRDFAYANDPAFWHRHPEKSKDKDDNRFLNGVSKLLESKGFKYCIYLLLSAILFYALYKIMAENNLGLFSRSSRKASTDMEGEGEVAEEDLDARLQQALLDKDYRLAVRYLFLKSLWLLNERGMIHYHLQATNQEYINQLNERPQAERFRFLARAYDHVWYGRFSLSEQQFDRLSGYFTEFLESLPHE